MDKKNIYTAIDEKPYFTCRRATFEGVKGMATSQKTKNSERLHDIFEKSWHEPRPLEVSSAGITELGKSLSAFNLIWHREGEKDRSVEQIFQSTKTFRDGGPFTDILDKKSNTAKTDKRFTESGPLKCFTFNNHAYPLKPKGCFYDWLYIKALMTNPELSKEVLDYDSFTDIFFNPDKQVNCQAEACAIFVGLSKKGKLEKAMRSFTDFKSLVY